MLIKKTKNKNQFFYFIFDKIKYTRKRFKILVVLVLLSIYSAGLVLSGVYAKKLVIKYGTHLDIKEIAMRVGKIYTEPYGVFSRYIKGLTVIPERITIDINHINFQKIIAKRESAFENTLLVSSSEDYVPARITHDNNTIEVKLRLKGDVSDHYRGEKWSYRIKVKGDETLFGMKIFSIQHPRTRGYIDEWIFHQALKREGIMHIRYKFVDVILNGKKLGIYALEEHFDKRLIEHNNQKEGPILKFSEELIWNNYIHYGEFSKSYYTYMINQIETFQTNKINKNPLLKIQSLKAISLFEAYRKGELKISEVFDIDKFSKFLAISTLFGANHGLSQRNTRFYYNPITSKIEPIGYDAGSSSPLSFEFIISEPYIRAITKDYVLFEEYVKHLKKMSDTSYIDSFRYDIKEDLDRNLSIIYSEFPWETGFPEVLYENQQTLRKVLNPVKGIHAFQKTISDKYIDIELGNVQPIPIEIVDVVYKGDTFFKPDQRVMIPGHISQGDTLFTLDKRLIIGGHVYVEPVHFRSVRFYFPEGFSLLDTTDTDFQVTYKLLGVDSLRQEMILPRPYTNKEFVHNDFIKEKSNIHDCEFLVVDQEKNIIRFKTGKWSLSKNLIIPKGYKIFAYPGLELNLINSAKILSFSPLNFIGDKDNHIYIHSADSSGQGIVIMQVDQPTTFEYVDFTNLSNPVQSGWELSGAITFYESPVNISYCSFNNNRAEDSINIIRSIFQIDNTVFNSSFSDAFDADFSQGDITDSFFINSGNDAMDFSGSIVNIRNVNINGSGDKGISAGEQSLLMVDSITIKRTNIALASKDLSEIKIDNSNIFESKIGFAVFEKKSEFGSASILANNIIINSTDSLYMVEEGSFMMVDGKNIESDQEGLKKTIYNDK